METRRMAALAGSAQRDAHQESLRADASERDLAAAQAALAAERQKREALDVQASEGTEVEAVKLGDYAQLRLALHSKTQELALAKQLLAHQEAKTARRVQAAAERAAQLRRPMPEGVRLCLRALHDCLRIEGFGQQRFLAATVLDDEGLHDVEMLDTSKDGLEVTFYSAKRMTATLSRDAGALVLRFFEGHRSCGGEMSAFPEDGLALTFTDVDGRLLESKLPFLVVPEGVYPVARKAEDQDQDTGLDPETRRQWLNRLDRVLETSTTEYDWRVTRLRGMKDGYFLAVELVGTDSKGRVMSGANCARMALEIDEGSGVVSMLLKDGVLRFEHEQLPISGEGYRMLLPGLTREATIDAMLGMVVTK
jgi:hypothetical protein